MTKYKEYLRAKGTKLEYDPTAPYNIDDFEINTYAGIEIDVCTEIMDNCIVVVTYSNITTPEYEVYNRYGEHNYYDSDDYHAYVGDPHCDPEYIDFLYDTGCNKSFDVFEDMEQLYLKDAKTRIAFKHMKAGIMDYMVFYKWISDRHQTYINQ